MKQLPVILLSLTLLLLIAACTRTASEISGTQAQTEPSDAQTQSQSAPAAEPDSTDAIALPDETEPTAAPTTAAPQRTTGAPPASTTAPPATAAEKSYAFQTESFRKHPTSGRTDERTFPAAHLLLSQADVQDYIAQNDAVYGFDLSRAQNAGETLRDYETLFAKYDDAWFGTHQLILVELEESSGSIRDTVKSVTRTGSGEYTIVFDRHVPQVMTCDMAYYHVFIELETKDFQPTDRVSEIRMNNRTETSMAVEFTKKQ
ncbi:MAG: hypothetical protein IJT44_03515 [Clostridia bacterium]|nr:hypothetical protein [Clostridia bacterium]